MKTRNSMFEMIRILSLTGIMIYHLNSYTNFVQHDVAIWLSDFSIISFSILTGYFFFEKSKLHFSTMKFKNVDYKMASNTVFRKNLSRLVMALVFLNLIFVIEYFTKLTDHPYDFINENWYVYQLLIISFIGVFAQKFYFRMQNVVPMYVLLIIGIVAFCVGYWVIDIDYSIVRLWRIGLMIAGLGGGFIIAKMTTRGKLWFSIPVLVFVIIMVSFKISNIQADKVLLTGNKIPLQLISYLSVPALFAMFSIINFRSKIINSISTVYQYNLEVHWLVIFFATTVFKGSQIDMTDTGGILKILIVISGSTFLAFLMYLFNRYFWEKFVEKYMNIAIDYSKVFLKFAISKPNFTFFKEKDYVKS